MSFEDLRWYIDAAKKQILGAALSLKLIIVVDNFLDCLSLLMLVCKVLIIVVLFCSSVLRFLKEDTNDVYFLLQQKMVAKV